MGSRLGHPLESLLAYPALNVLGINSGTSLNSLDLVCVRIEGGRQPRVGKCASFRFPKNLHTALRQLATDSHVSKAAVSRTNMEFSRWMASCVRRFRSRLPRSTRIDLIGAHGQTIGHFPASKGHPGNATWQLGAPSVLAQETGIVTIGDFRTSDVAAGGMGAPLSGYYHHLLFGPDHAVLNLGGIANISASRIRKNRLTVLAFDTGPANMLIDGLARMLLKLPCDRAGRVASHGHVNQSVLRRALRHPYFKRRPPKTCGREEFGADTLLTWFPRKTLTPRHAADCLATATEITAQSVAAAVDRWVTPFTPARSLILTGGGVHNLTLVKSLTDHLPDWEVRTSVDFEIPPELVEPVGFATLAYETLHARPGNLGGATGGSPAVLGLIALPTHS